MQHRYIQPCIILLITVFLGMDCQGSATPEQRRQKALNALNTPKAVALLQQADNALKGILTAMGATASEVESAAVGSLKKAYQQQIEKVSSARMKKNLSKSSEILTMKIKFPGASDDLCEAYVDAALALETIVVDAYNG